MPPLTHVYLNINNYSNIAIDLKVYINNEEVLHFEHKDKNLNPLIGKIKIPKDISKIEVLGYYSINDIKKEFVLNENNLNDISEFTYPLHNKKLPIKDRLRELVNILNKLQNSIDNKAIYECRMHLNKVPKKQLKHLKSRLLEKEDEFNISFPSIIKELLEIDFYYDDNVETLYKTDVKDLLTVKNEFISMWGDDEYQNSEKHLSSSLIKKYERSIVFFSGCGDGCYGLAWDPCQYDGDRFQGENCGGWFWYAEDSFAEPDILKNEDKTPITDEGAIYSIFYKFALDYSFQITDTVMQNIDTERACILDINLAKDWDCLIYRIC